MWIIIAAVVLAAGFALLLKFGNRLGVLRVQRRYPKPVHDKIVFCGASNFTLWRSLEQDMLPHIVQNHGFGGSTDRELMKYADKILYPYKPKIVVFQSGSNDFAQGLSAEDILKNKDKMYTMFRKELPNTIFVALSMLPLPGRAQFWEQSKNVNAGLREYCRTHADMFFVDTTEYLTTSAGKFCPICFRRDGIHINRKGQLIWGREIKKILDRITLN